jgi:creatinine amidohydrolase
VSESGLQEIRLERMTWPEIGDAISRGMRTVLVPSGAVEQHGPHLPLVTDSVSSDAVAMNVARRLGGALVAPTIWLGCSEHHMGFPGTISLRDETLEALYHDCCVSLSRHGFETIVCFSWHSGNFAPLQEMEARLAAAVEGVARVIVWADLDGFFQTVKGVIEGRLGLGEQVGGHADITEASVMSYLRPELVRADLAAPGYLGPLDDELLSRVYSEGVHALSANGIVGDPRGMNAEAGRVCVERISELISEALRPGVGSADRSSHEEGIR